MKQVYKNASILANNRVIFNIKGNDFRLIVFLNFLQGTCYLIWFGTHKEYDKIDCETVPFDKNILTFIKKIVMNWKVLKTEDDYNNASLRLMEIFHATPNTPDGDEMELLLVLIQDYDNRRYAMPELDALDVIKIKMQEMGLKNKDLEPLIGTKGHVSLVMNGKRDITLKMAQRLKNHFNIPAGVFLHNDATRVVTMTNTEIVPT